MMRCRCHFRLQTMFFVLFCAALYLGLWQSGLSAPKRVFLVPLLLAAVCSGYTAWRLRQKAGTRVFAAACVAAGGIMALAAGMPIFMEVAKELTLEFSSAPLLISRGRLATWIAALVAVIVGNGVLVGYVVSLFWSAISRYERLNR